MKRVPVECCGKTRDSRFCPDCGKELGLGVLEGLIDYCRKNERPHRKRIEELKQRKANPQNDRDRDTDKLNRRIANKTRMAEKWKRWADAVQSLLDAQSSGKA